MKRRAKIREALKDYRRDTYLVERPSQCDLELEVIDCEVGYSPFGCSKKMLAGIREFDFTQVSRYSEMFYAELLKPCIVRYFQGACLVAKNIFFGHGSFNLAERIIHKFAVPKAMLGLGPQFNEIPSEMIAAGGSYKAISLRDDFSFPREEIISELESGNYSVLYLDNPNNPTGNLILLEVLSDLVRVAEEHGVLVIIDEAYGDFVGVNNSAFNLVRHYANLIVIRSFSKALGLAAMRVGYMAISDELIDDYSKVDVPFEPSLVGVVMAKLTLEDNDFLESVRISSRRCKADIMGALACVGLRILPTHPDVSILTIYRRGFDLFDCFRGLGIKVENGMAYEQTCSWMDHSFVRLRVPRDIQVNEVVRRILSCQF